MASETAENASAITFSTKALPTDIRLHAMCDYLADMMRVEVESLVAETPIEYSAGLCVVPGASWGSAYASAVVTTRTAALAQDGQDDLMLVVPDIRMIIQARGANDLEVRPGEAVLFSQAREMRIVHPDAGHAWALRVPHADIAAMVPGLGSAPVLSLPAGTPMLSLLKRYGRILETEPLAGATQQKMVARQLQEMMSLAIGASADFWKHAEETTVAAVRLNSIRAEIAAHLGNSNLRLEWIAARQNVTPRHLQRILAREGLHFNDMLRRARVAKARALLEDPRSASRTILSIALECGFPEASALNRAFRQEYGLRPGDVR